MTLSLTAPKRFAIAVSFPSQHRRFVRNVVKQLSEQLGRDRVFYDEWYEAELVGLDGDLKLKRYYREQCEMVVPFFSEHYTKPWCRIEWHAIRAMLLQRRAEDAVVPVELDGTRIEGWEAVDFAIRRGGRTATQIAEQILAAYRHRHPQSLSASGQAETPPPDLGQRRRRPEIHVGDISDAVERPDEMDWLRSHLLSKVPHAHSTYVVLWGEPGVGKTFLAEYFARKHFETTYISIFVGQESPESAASDICRRLGGGGYPMPSTTHAIELMEARLRGGLLILDNVEDPSIRSLIPSAAVKTIVTTTNPRVAGEIAGAGNVRYIGEFSSSQSVALFQKYRRFERQDEDALVELSKRVGNLPLAVAMAARYLSYHEAEPPGALLDNIIYIEPLHEILTSLFYKNFMQVHEQSQTLLVRLSCFSEGGAYSNLLMTMFRYEHDVFWKHVYDAKATSLLHIVRSSGRDLLKSHPLVRRFLQARDVSGTHQKEFLEALSREFRVRSPETIDFALIEQIRLLDVEIMVAHLEKCATLLLEVNEALKRTRFSVIESFDRLFSRGDTALRGYMRYRDLCVAAAEEAHRLNLLSKERKYLDLVGERI